MPPAMPMDPATTAFLDAMRAAGGKPVHEQTIDEFRALVRATSAQLGPRPPEVHDSIDRQIDVGGRAIGIRVYTPRPLTAGQTLPLIVHYHGAGFVAGDLDTHDAIARFYCRHADAIVVSVDYRLAPEHPFPAGVDDCFDTLRWTATHASELHGDAGRLAVTGDSAGGNLSAVVCQLARERGGPRIAFQALVYPGVDFDLDAAYPSRRAFGGGEYFISNRDLLWYRSHYLTDVPRQVGDPRVSPLAARDLTGLPPALVLTAGYDLFCDEGKAYADRLSAAGVPVEYRCFDSTIHAFCSFAGAIPAGLEALTFVASRLHTALHAVDPSGA